MRNLNDDLSHLARCIVRGEEAHSQIDNSYENYALGTAIGVYRNNYRANLHDALAGAYPVIKQLVGDNFFRLLALRFIDQHPSLSANLHRYGAELANFVATFEPATDLVYLSEIAALEWACHLAYFEKDEPVLDLGQLAQVPPEQHPDLLLYLQPACRLVHSRYPIYAIWQAHQPGAHSNFHIDLTCGHFICLVSRKENSIQVTALSEAEAEWLRHIQDGNPLGASTATALERYPDFDLPSTLLKLAAQNVLADFSLSPRDCADE